MEVAFVLGNGESRKGIQIEELKKIGKVFACNGVYRSDTPDVLVAVDPKMLLEIAENDYMDNNVVWSNYNAMYEKHSKIMEKVQFFQPSLGWSSGPTALKYAADLGSLIVGHPQDINLSKDTSATSSPFATLRGLPAVSTIAEKLKRTRDHKMSTVEVLNLFSIIVLNGSNSINKLFPEVYIALKIIAESIIYFI